jgi:Protein of unknown function (DUF3298)/Deacetylase PdaC
MKQTLNLLSCLFFLLILGACKPEKNAEEKDLGQTALSNATYAYVQLKGELAGQKATLHLMQDRSYEDLAYYHGSMVYDETNLPISIYGGADTTGTVILNLAIYDQEETPNLAGKFVNQGFEGEYYDPATKQKSPFRFELSKENQGVEFSGHILQDSVLGNPDLIAGPRAKVRFEYLKAKNFPFLNDLIIQNYQGDSIEDPVASLEAAFKSDRDTFYTMFKRDYEENGVDAEFGNMMMMYETESSMEVLYNSPDLLSLAYTTYAYTGGAHGNYGSSCASYDLKKQKRITLDDLFKPGYKTTLGDELTKMAKKQFNTDKLDSVLFVDRVEANGNFFLTPSGICFNYVPYEIGAYAMGEIKLFVPFENLKAIRK